MSLSTITARSVVLATLRLRIGSISNPTQVKDTRLLELRRQFGAEWSWLDGPGRRWVPGATTGGRVNTYQRHPGQPPPAQGIARDALKCWVLMAGSALFPKAPRSQATWPPCERWPGYQRIPGCSFCRVSGADHFSILAPTTRLIAESVLREDGPVTHLAFSEKDLNQLFGR